MAEELTPTLNLQGYLNQQTLIYILFWVVFIAGIIIFLVCITLGVWYLTYRIRIRYYQVIGKDKDNKEILRYIGGDKAKLVKLRGGIYNLRFFWKRKKIEPPPEEAYLPTKKGYEMHVKTDGIDIVPMSLRANPGFETIPMHKRLWHVQTQKIAVEQYSKPTWWERYGTLVLTMGTVLLCLAAMAFTVWYAYKLGVIAINANREAAATIASNAKAFAPGA